MEQSVQYVNMCESPTCCASHCDDVEGCSLTFFAIANFFSEVTTDGHPKHSKSSSVYSFLIFLKIKFSIERLDGDTEFGNFGIKSSRTRFKK